VQGDEHGVEVKETKKKKKRAKGTEGFAAPQAEDTPGE
jgi:hypothetical protein